MIYILFICVMTFFVFDMIRIRRMSKHDNVLFPFCQLRRDIMDFLYEGVFEAPGALSREDYVALRGLSETLDTTIRNYNQHKTLMFDLRKMVKHLNTYRHTADPLPKFSAQPKVREFQERFGRLLVKAFIAYTPLIRWELALRLIALAYRASKEADARRAAKEDAEKVIGGARRVREDAHRYGLLRAGAVA